MHVITKAAETGQSPPIAVLQTDFCKAFDGVDGDYLFTLLNYCDVCSKIEQWLNVCYTDTTVNLLIDGAVSALITIERSER